MEIHALYSLVIETKKNDLKVNETTMFNAASISKPISAYVALKIYADKKINYREPINKVLKGSVQINVSPL